MSWVEAWNSACCSSCSRGDRPLVELYLEPAGFSRRWTGVSVSLRVAISSTGLHAKRCPGIGFLSTADRDFRVIWNVAPPTRPHLKFPHETGLILTCDGYVGKPFKTKQGNRPSYRDDEERRGSGEVVPGTSLFLSRETGMSGNFVGRIKAAKNDLELQEGMWDFS